VPQPLRHIGAHGKTQPRFISGPQGGKDQAVVLGHIAPTQLVV
jgi:hypothetical protein